MATSPAHRPTRSMTTNNLQTPSPGGARPRRLTSPSQTSLSIPEGGHQPQFVRPPSPLRNGFIPDTGTGIDPNQDSDSGDDDDEENGRWVERSPSPSSSVSQLAANLAQRVGSFVDGMKSRSHLPTDEELEAEAQRERDRSRREAEAILTREAQQRRQVEERVLAMMDSAKSLPPPPSRGATMSNPPSPSPSQKERDGVSWWAAAKNRLTPTKEKEPLTPAQQVIQEAKAREKDIKKSNKGKEKEKSGDWPAIPHTKLGDGSYSNLNIPPSSPQRKPVPGSPVSPTPSRPSISNMPPNLTPSPMRSGENISSSSPSREAPPLYAQFNGQGTLDVAGTLLVIAKRFEKLEKWTVGHVRALEERMNDVERWLVDKEKEREQREKKAGAQTASSSPPTAAATATNPAIQQDLNEIREEIGELQGRVGELGREMAKIATAPANLSSGPSRQSPVINSASPTNSMIAHHSPSASASSTPGHSRLISVTARESTSPPMAASSKASGTRLPYPTGDYTHPLNNSFSPPSSPPSTKSRPMSIPGLPAPSTNTTNPNTNSNIASAALITRTMSPSSSLSSLTAPATPSNNNNRAISPSASVTSLSRSPAPSPSSSSLPPPKTPKRPSSVSPTPRKRYTVALGEPIRSQSPPVDEEVVMTPMLKRDGGNSGAGGGSGGGTPISFHKPQTSIGTAMFSSGSGSSGGMFGDVRGDEGGDEPDAFQDETIGKSAARLVNLVTNNNNKTNTDNSDVFNSIPTSAPAKSTDFRFPHSSSTSASSGGGAPSALTMNLNSTTTSHGRPPRRPRPQSTYTFSTTSSTTLGTSSTNNNNNVTTAFQASIQPLKPRVRSKSTERFGSVESLSSMSSFSSATSGISGASGASGSSTNNGGGGGKFVDPLVLRKQKEKEKKGGGVGADKPRGKVPVGQLVAFFDKDKSGV